MISVIENGNSYEIRSKYDPTFIAMIKEVPGRVWHPDSKIWTIPHDRLGFLLNQVKGTAYEHMLSISSSEQLGVNDTLDATTVIPDIDPKTFRFRVAKGLKPFNHQIDFMKYAIGRYQQGSKQGFILADQPGLGKTVEIYNLACYRRTHNGAKHCLIVCCVNSAKYNWVADIVKHSNGKDIPYILGSRRRRGSSQVRCDTGNAAKLEDLTTGRMYGDPKGDKLPYFLVVNIEAFRCKDGKYFPFADKIIEWINSGEISIIALDEIHKNTSATSTQGKQILRIKKSCNVPVEWVPMTGTPITNKPTDVFLPLKLVGGHNFSSYYTWCQQFCVFGGFGGHEILGYKNIPKLKSLLQDNMLRRLKSDVLDLPDKVHIDEMIENSKYQSDLYAKVLQDVRVRRDEILSSMNPMAQLLALRQVNGSPELVDKSLTVDNLYLSKNAKLSRLIEIVSEIVDNGEKVVIFSNWVEPLRTVYRFLSARWKTACYTGTMSQDNRELHKKMFIEDPECPIMIGTIGALGTSHTLTVANNIIFYDEPWSPSDREQAEDRCHRAGTTKTINVYTLIIKDTVDERVHNILSTKEGVADYIVDNKLDIKNRPELFDMLLGKN